MGSKFTILQWKFYLQVKAILVSQGVCSSRGTLKAFVHFIFKNFVKRESVMSLQFWDGVEVR